MIFSWRSPLDHVYEETDDAFLCSRGQEGEKMILLACKLSGCQRQEFGKGERLVELYGSATSPIGRGQRGQRLFLDDPNLSFGDCLGSDVLFFGVFQSKNIA